MITAMSECAVGPCHEVRVQGRSFCGRHGPKLGRVRVVEAGPRDGELLCPHCQTRGTVRTDRVKVKRGISGGKATGAVLTAGVSLFATGLSRKEQVLRATCGNCRVVWTI